MAAFPLLLEEWKHRWVGFPPPTRWTWLLTIAWIERLWPHPSDDYHPIVVISVVAGVLAVVPLGLWLRRIAPPEVAVLAMLLLALSPLCIGMSKYPVPDEWQLLNTLLALWLTADWLAAPRAWKLVALGAVAFVLVTVRETGLLSVIAAASLVALDARRQGRWRLAPAWAMLMGCLVALVTVPFIVGGISAFVSFIGIFVPGSLSSTGNKPYVSGPYYRYVVDLMIVAPAVVVTSIAAASPLLRRVELRRPTMDLLVVTLTLFALNSLFPKSLRYVMSVEVGMRVLCALAVWALWTGSMRRGRAWAVALLLFLVAHDVTLWSLMWRDDQVYDPTTYSIARQLYFIPY